MSLQLSPQVAARELLDRRRARRSLLQFTQYTYPRYLAEPAHELIASWLEAVLKGEVQRLMIFAPPQHGKTELVSVRFPAFWLAHRPEDPVMLTSYAASLAHTKSRESRAVVESPAFGNLFEDITTDPASRARDQWRLAGHRGGMVAAGVGGPITGHGAALGIVDDPVENWEQAQSEVYRDKTWDWYKTTFRTRIWEHGAIVIVMTRWHEDDLCGRLLNAQAGQWDVLRLPATGERQSDRDLRNQKLHQAQGLDDPLDRGPGDALCPQRFSAEALADLQRDVGSLGWESQYMGCPTAPEGNRFKRAWFVVGNGPPSGYDSKRIRYWDKAGTEDGGAYTAGVLMGYCRITGLFYIENVVRGQWSALEREQVIRQTAELDRSRYGNVAVWIEQEPGSGGKESAEATVRNLAGFSVHVDRVTGSKDVRLEPFAAQAEALNVRLVRGAWNSAYVDEMCAVPAGQYRDQADATAGAFNKLAGQATLSRGPSPLGAWRG